MSLEKVTYVDNETVIHAQNLNDIQDAIIDAEILSGNTAPTTATVGVVGQLYVDTTEKKIYRCDAVSGTTYTWNLYGGGGTAGDIPYDAEIDYDDGTVGGELNAQSATIANLKSSDIQFASDHMGLYRDADGDLCEL